MAIKGFVQEECLSPIDEGEIPEENESSIKRYTEANKSEEDNLSLYDTYCNIIIVYWPKMTFSSRLSARRDPLPYIDLLHGNACRMVSRCPAPLEAYFHKAQAIRLMSEKLSTSSIETDTFDKVINTIFFLLITELDGMPEVLRIHWDGLILAVRMAGGLKNLGLSGITRRCVLWYVTDPNPYFLLGDYVHLNHISSLTAHRADLATAMILKEEPRLLPPCPEISLFDYFGLRSPGTSCLATAFGARIYIFTGSKELSQEASTAFWGLRSISELKAIRMMEAFVDTAGPDDIQYSDRISSLERVLVPLWRVRNEECQHAGLLRMFAWASLIYIYSELRDAPQGMGLYGRIAERIREEIHEGHELEPMYEAFPNLMLWIFFIAGRCAHTDSKLYFARGAAKILAAQEVYEETDVELASRAFLWPIDKAIPVNRSPVHERGNLSLLLTADTKVHV